MTERRAGGWGRTVSLVAVLAGLVAVVVLWRWMGTRGREGGVILSSEETEVIDYFRAELQKESRLPTLAQAMEAVGFPYSSVERLRLANYLLDSRGLSPKVLQWSPDAFILTNPERLVARYIAATHATTEGSVPTRKAISVALGMEEKDVRAALEILDELGFLTRSRWPWSRTGYTVSEESLKEIPSWALQFVEVRPEGHPPFNVQCAIDAGHIIEEEFAAGAVSVKTACAHCTAPITLTYDRGRLAAATPPGVTAMVGGTCPTNLLFVSTDHLTEYVSAHPELRKARRLPVGQLYSEIATVQ